MQEAGFCTIGHANRTPGEFIAMLREAGVGELVDVRRFPRSRANPAFNIDVLPGTLAPFGIGYRHMPALGGRRARSADIAPEINAYWHHPSFHNYADYALSAPFNAALAEVVALGKGQRIALMCAEAVWWRCHRRIITDHLLLSGHGVTHLMAPGRSEPATPTPGAVLRADGAVVYPAPLASNPPAGAAMPEPTEAAGRTTAVTPRRGALTPPLRNAGGTPA